MANARMSESFFQSTGAQIVPEVEPPADSTKGEKGLEASAKFPDSREIPASHVTDPSNSSETDSIDKDAQPGVQAVEALTTAWSKNGLIFAYVMIWVFFFVDTMQQGMAGNLSPYVTSAFSLHSLTATTGILSSIIGGLTKLPLAKILDIWGRPQGFALMIFFLTIGLIMMAGCNNVETYAAGQVFYWVGQNGVSYTLSIFVADTSSLKNRGFMLAYLSSPYLITTWISPYLAESFLSAEDLPGSTGPGWRWGFGTFAIIIPVVSLPLFWVFYSNYNKAKKMGLLHREPSGRNWKQSVKHYVIEFDLAGLLILITGLSLFLLSFSLYSYQPNGWRSPLPLCFIIIGFLLIVSFVFYEKYVAPVTFLPYHLLTDRTILGATALPMVSFISFYCWDAYFISFLQAVNGLSVLHAGYVANIYTMGSCFWSFLVGIAIRKTGRVKPFSLYFGVPLSILGIGLMIHFRQPDVNIGFIVMCQIFISFAGGTNVICQQTIAMAAVPHRYIATVLAIEGMSSSLGNAIGGAISTAIWTDIYPARLLQYLPASDLPNFASIYGMLPVQVSYPLGSPTRIAIQQAYADAQRYMLIAGTCFWIIAIPAVIAWRDIRVKDFKQVKGRVV